MNGVDYGANIVVAPNVRAVVVLMFCQKYLNSEQGCIDFRGQER